MRPPAIPHLIPIYEHDLRHTKIMKQLYNALVEYREPKTNRIVIQSFISLPSRKEFPEYFDIIERPISMYEIRKRIESNTYYRNEDTCLNDIRLMFNNCRVFNEDLSQIFKDAVKLEEILLKRYEQCSGKGLSPQPVAAGAVGAVAVAVETKPTTIIPTTPTNGRPKISATSGAGGDVSTPATPAITDDSLIINHDFHNETSIDSSSNLSIPSSVDKPRRLKRDRDAPKRRLLTGYIIYAAEVRKEYVDKHPNQDFGFISRLIGNDWKALPRDLRLKYDQKALAHNKKIRERALRETMLGTPETKKPTADDQQQQSQQPDGQHQSPKQRLGKISKRKLAKELNGRSSCVGTTPSSRSSERHLYSSSSSVTIESSTQTQPIRFVEPPQRKFAYSENFRRYIESLEVPNRDLLFEETAQPERAQPEEGAISILGAGIGRHKTHGEALWALRDFLLQDVETMRWNMQPYTYYSNDS